MEFWGLEVKPGQTVSCDAGDECAIHISQVALGETKKKGSENVVVSAKVGGNKMVIGNLSSGQHPQFIDADSTDSTTFDDDMDSSSTDGEDESSDDDESDKSPAEESSSSSMESSDEEDGSDGDDEDETDEEDEITKKPESSKMKAAGSIFNTPSGQKTAKEAKSNEKTRKSSDTQACKSCSKAMQLQFSSRS
uniref:Nucleoplasmin-like domain-containing protein n=1 Tax=Leersia perrieri TaxID=77586 RepID=A0A0D9V9B2_9ORYZ